jgi:hypothetical protein
MKSKSKPVTTAAAARKKRQALELARGTRFWLNLRASLDESREHGIPLAEARRRLDERLSVEARGQRRRKAAHR